MHRDDDMAALYIYIYIYVCVYVCMCVYMRVCGVCVCVCVIYILYPCLIFSSSTGGKAGGNGPWSGLRLKHKPIMCDSQINSDQTHRKRGGRD